MRNAASPEQEVVELGPLLPNDPDVVVLADPEGNQFGAPTPNATAAQAATKGAWSKVAVRAIVDNPRYIGREVWNPAAP